MQRLRFLAVGAVTGLVLSTTAFVTPADAAIVVTFSVANCTTPVSATYGKDCGLPLRAAANALEAGDRLRITAGTYEVGDITILDPPGTASAPITITGANASNKPLLKGNVTIRQPYYTTISNIRFEATVPGKAAFGVVCGIGWTVTGSEFFGASNTKSASNMVIAGRQPGPPNPDGGTTCLDEPRGFRLAENFFHDPFTDPTLENHPDPDIRRTASFYHNVYASFEGSTGTGGTIERNVFQGNRNGAGIKLGDGKFETLGPWNVTVRFNTFYDGMRGIVLVDDVRNNLLHGNLIVKMNGGGGVSGPRVGVAVNRVYNQTNRLRHTYGFDLLKIWGATSTGSQLKIGPDNQIRGDPGFTDAQFHTSAPEAAPYGRWGTGAFS